MPVTLLSGVTGVGLTSICQRVRAELDDGYLLLNFGDIMLEEAATQNITTERGDLATLSQRQIRRLQRRAGEYVADAATESNVLLSTHLTVRTDHGYIHGLPDSVLRDVAPSTVVLVEAAPETVLERRAESGRSVEEVTERQIEFEQSLNRTAALECARERNTPVAFVENEGRVIEAVEAVVETVEAH